MLFGVLHPSAPAVDSPTLTLKYRSVLKNNVGVKNKFYPKKPKVEKKSATKLFGMILLQVLAATIMEHIMVIYCEEHILIAQTSNQGELVAPPQFPPML